jgi:hypothetical protein
VSASLTGLSVTAVIVAVLAAVATALGPVGESVEGTPIKVQRTGAADAPKVVLAVGAIHGNERAGRAVIRALRRSKPPRDVQVHTVYTANPDGEAAGTRQNARGVDLNRNWPYRWRGGGAPFDTYFPGPSAASEPETRAMMRLIRRLEPDVTLWYHQALSLVNLPRPAHPADAGIIRRYGRAVGLPARKLPFYRGTATSWQNHHFPDSTAFVVELDAGSLSRAQARRHARAALATPNVARLGTTAESSDVRRPRMVQDRIPFPSARRRQMAAYSMRHYGVREHRLLDVRTIVQHYTASDSYASAWNTFAANDPDVEFGERPGVCAHFLIDSDGTIHQLVALKLRCRHTVGLNHRSIGIEHVGTSDAAVMENPAVLRSSLRLTRWLQRKFGVPRRHVIGHAESLSSPFHQERVEEFKGRTHSDMQPATMRRYRKRL